MTAPSKLRPFEEILAIAEERKGGAAAFEATLSSPKSPEELVAIPDHRWLSNMSMRIFQAGFNWSVVADKWPRFEEVFEGFDIGRMSMMSDDDLDGYMKTDGIIRHGTKLRSIRENAVFLRDLAKEHGTAAKAFAHWPHEDYVGLLWLLKKRGSRLGGNTGMYVLRFMGVDSFIISTDVGKALIREGVVDKPPSSKRDLDAVQAAFNHWREESGRPFTQISRILACSID